MCVQSNARIDSNTHGQVFDTLVTYLYTFLKKIILLCTQLRNHRLGINPLEIRGCFILDIPNTQNQGKGKCPRVYCHNPGSKYVIRNAKFLLMQSEMIMCILYKVLIYLRKVVGHKGFECTNGSR